MIRRPPRSPRVSSSAASAVYKRQPLEFMGEMQHNIVIFKDESAAPEIIKLAESYFGGDAPDDNRILAKSILIDKQEETTIEFDAPKKPGRYLYVCTYIAHAGSMRGYMIVD